jgi:hypothetical protein
MMKNRFVVYVKIPENGEGWRWVKVGSYRLWETALRRCGEFHPLMTRLLDTTTGNSTWAGGEWVMDPDSYVGLEHHKYPVEVGYEA